MSKQLRIHTADGEFSCYVARSGNAVAAPVVIVIQEIFGVNAGIRSIADGYAAKSYLAIAPDLFWRGEPNLDLSDKSEQDLAKGFAQYNAYDFARGVHDIAATVAAARTLDGASGKVGITGYCLGGLMTFLSAAGTDADAFAAYYGGGTDQHLSIAAEIKKPLLYHLADADEYIGEQA